MRTLLALSSWAAAGAAVAHDGHGDTSLHSHAFDVLGLAGVIAAVAWWLWQRSQR
jgi:hypothetical protein